MLSLRINLVTREIGARRDLFLPLSLPPFFHLFSPHPPPLPTPPPLDRQTLKRSPLVRFPCFYMMIFDALFFKWASPMFLLRPPAPKNCCRSDGLIFFCVLIYSPGSVSSFRADRLLLLRLVLISPEIAPLVAPIESRLVVLSDKVNHSFGIPLPFESCSHFSSASLNSARYLREVGPPPLSRGT